MYSKARSRGFQVPGQQLQGGDVGHDHHVHKVPVGDIPAHKWIKAVDSKARSRGFQVPAMMKINDLVTRMVDLEASNSSRIRTSYPLTWPAATDLPVFCFCEPAKTVQI